MVVEVHGLVKVRVQVTFVVTPEVRVTVNLNYWEVRLVLVEVMVTFGVFASKVA